MSVDGLYNKVVQCV